MTEAPIPEDVARRIFYVAANTERCSELWACLTAGGSATVDPDGRIVMVTADQLAQMMPDDDEDVLVRDGHGIERMPISLSYRFVHPDVDEAVDPALCIVRVDQLDALEDLLFDARDLVALVTPQGIRWEDEAERAGIFARGNVLWARMTGVLRGDEA